MRNGNNRSVAIIPSLAAAHFTCLALLLLKGTLVWSKEISVTYGNVSISGSVQHESSTYTSGTYILGTDLTLQHEGVLEGWKFSIDSMINSDIRLAIFRPLPEEGSDVYKFVDVTVWQSPRNTGDYHIIIASSNRLNLLKGDLIGLQWLSGNPVSYVDKEECTAEDHIRFIYQHVDYDPGQKYTFTKMAAEESPCRSFSLEVHVMSLVCVYVESDSLFGFFTSQGFPSNYLSDTDECFIAVSTSSSKLIVLTVITSDLEDSANCTNPQAADDVDRIAVRDGSASSSELMFQWCGSKHPEQIVTSGPQAFIRFQTNSATQRAGFQIKYETAIEGDIARTLVAVSNPNFLFSDNFPANYESYQDVTWLLGSSHSSSRLVIQYNTVYIEPGDDGSTCDKDWLDVRDGGKRSSELLRTVCGLDVYLPSDQTTQNQALLRFVSDASTEYSGFEISYFAKYPEGGSCLYVFALPHAAELKSSSYPLAYNDNSDECFVIQKTSSVTDQSIVLEVESSDIGADGEKCDDSFVEIREGLASDSPLLWTWCGSLLPRIVTTGDGIHIRFMSGENSDGHTGFKLKYWLEKESTCTTNTANIVAQTYKSQLAATYAANVDTCVVFHTSDVSKSIDVRFTFFNLEGSEACAKDAVEIRDGDSKLAVLMARLCGNDLPDPDTFISTGAALYIRFTSDSSINLGGFQLKFQEKSKLQPSYVCFRYVALTNAQRFDSPNYPLPYERNSDICYTIDSADSSLVVTVDIPEVIMESETVQGCVNDYIAVHDGMSVSDSMLGIWCGRQSHISVSTTQSHAYVHFVSDNSLQMKGFRLIYYMSHPDGSGPISDEPSDLSSTITAIVFGVLLFSVLVGMGVIIYLKHSGKKKRRIRPSIVAGLRTALPTMNQQIMMVGRPMNRVPSISATATPRQIDRRSSRRSFGQLSQEGNQTWREYDNQRESIQEDYDDDDAIEEYLRNDNTPSYIPPPPYEERPPPYHPFPDNAVTFTASSVSQAPDITPLEYDTIPPASPRAVEDRPPPYNLRPRPRTPPEDDVFDF